MVWEKVTNNKGQRPLQLVLGVEGKVLQTGVLQSTKEQQKQFKSLLYQIDRACKEVWLQKSTVSLLHNKKLQNQQRPDVQSVETTIGNWAYQHSPRALSAKDGCKHVRPKSLSYQTKKEKLAPIGIVKLDLD